MHKHTTLPPQIKPFKFQNTYIHTFLYQSYSIITELCAGEPSWLDMVKIFCIYIQYVCMYVLWIAHLTNFKGLPDR